MAEPASAPAPPQDVHTQLDDDIAALHAQVSALRRSLQLQCSTILACDSTRRHLLASASSPPPTRPGSLASRCALQRSHIQQSVYRLCNPVTAFKIHDPDPNAVDGGHVLALRFEIMSRGQFLRPYYLMLNRPFAYSSSHLRIHRHTLPPAIPLSGLAARYLPAPSPDADPQPYQDLLAFASSLRRHIMRYHNRLGVAADLRRRLGLRRASTPRSAPDAILDVSVADTDARQITLTWADGSEGRLLIDDDGNVLKLVIFGPRGRDWETAKKLLASSARMEDIASKLEARPSTS